jgi:8-oxo-dGTP pyrophosphatase MutT (NUDIX family)
LNAPAPVATRPAATVILVRRHDGDLQVYLLKRSLKSVYMAGFYVFPGGVLDPQDRESFWQRCLDCGPQAVTQRFGDGLAPAELTAFGVAAIRETFEEAGVLLVSRRPGSGDGLQPVHARRMADGLPPGWLNQLVTEKGWTLQLSALFPWSHWITPEAMKYRFEARFFLADLPPGQACRPDGRETIDGVWMTPAAALAANMAGEIPLSPPNLVTLQQMLPFQSVDALKQEALRRGWGRAMMPRMFFLEGGTVILEPWDPQFHEKELRLDPGTLRKAFLPAGQPFSRLFFCQGRWRPVAAE